MATCHTPSPHRRRAGGGDPASVVSHILLLGQTAAARPWQHGNGCDPGRAITCGGRPQLAACPARPWSRQHLSQHLEHRIRLLWPAWFMPQMKPRYPSSNASCKRCSIDAHNGIGSKIMLFEEEKQPCSRAGGEARKVVRSHSGC